MVRTRTAIAIAVVPIISVGVGAGAYAAASGNGTTTTVVVDRAAESVLAAAPKNLSVAQVYLDTYQGVVEITDEVEPQVTVEGSGFVYDAQGHVVTNYHVVKAGHSIELMSADGSKHPASVVAHDASTDLAVLKVDAPLNKLHPLTLGDASKVRVGDGVVAIGSPFGLDETVTSGIVSALDRTISPDNSYSISGAIQTDAAINHGNSGGPLLNMQGEVIGVTSQIESDGGGSDGVGFAISSNTIRSVVSQLLAGGKAEHAYLGVSVGASPSRSGALIASVKSGSPAAKAGLEANDLISALNGHKITSPEDLVGAVSGKQPGERVTITYARGGRTKTVRVVLGSRGGGNG